MRPRVAVIGTGMIASGVFAQGIPALVNALGHLSTYCDITVYSFAPLDKMRIPHFVRARWVPAGLHQRVQYFLLAAIFLLDHCRKKYVAIHAQSPFPGGVLAIPLSKFLRIKCVISLHAGESVALNERQFGDLLKPGMAQLTQRICQSADVLTTMSTYQADLTRSNLKLRRAIEVFPRGLEISAKELPAKDLQGPLRLIFIANFHPVKDPDTLLLAFREIVRQREASLAIIGDNYDEKFSERILQMHLEPYVTRMGALPHERAMEELRSAHLLINTSFYEALPMTAIEAMAAGVAVVGTHVGIMADTADQCCLTVSPGDYQSMAAKVITLCRDHRAYDSLRAEAFKWVKRHAMEKYIQKLLGFYGIKSLE